MMKKNLILSFSGFYFFMWKFFFFSQEGKENKNIFVMKGWRIFFSFFSSGCNLIMVSVKKFSRNSELRGRQQRYVELKVGCGN